jgi:hypothetical protein
MKSLILRFAMLPISSNLLEGLLWAQPPGSGLLYPLMNAATVAVELYLKCLSAEKGFHCENGNPNNRHVL